MNFLKIFDSKINIADDWIRTVDLWIRKQPLYQLRHNHKNYIISPTDLIMKPTSIPIK